MHLNDRVAENILNYLKDDRIKQGIWESEEEGKRIACLLGAGLGINSVEECPAELMPKWMAGQTVYLFDGISDIAIPEISSRYAHLVKEWKILSPESWDSIRKKFAVALIEIAEKQDLTQNLLLEEEKLQFEEVRKEFHEVILYGDAALGKIFSKKVFELFVRFTKKVYSSNSSQKHKSFICLTQIFRGYDDTTKAYFSLNENDKPEIQLEVWIADLFLKNFRDPAEVCFKIIFDLLLDTIDKEIKETSSKVES